MYNPYVEEQSYFPVEVESELSSVAPEVDLEGKLPSLKSLMGMKDILGKLGGFSFLGDLLSGGKEKSTASSASSLSGGVFSSGGSSSSMPAFMEESSSQTGGGFLQEMKGKFHLEDLDGGDILLVLILIYLMIEGDDKIELAITMGILAFLWYLDHKSKEKTAESMAEGMAEIQEKFFSE